MQKSKISIVGAGPVGTMLSIFLSRHDLQVEVLEKRSDPRTVQKSEGRSINIALSHRGLKALNCIGMENLVKDISIPMKGRTIHNEKGALAFQPYGEEGQVIYSVSRNELNNLLVEKAEKEYKVKFSFNHHCDEVDIEKGVIKLSTSDNKYDVFPNIIFGADGAFSAVRKSFTKYQDFHFEQETLSHAYKELHIPPDNRGNHVMEKNALHIWPREKFMLIALPNNDGSFTSTLFLPITGKDSFEEINTKEKLISFFNKNFPDAVALMPQFVEDYFAKEPSSLVTVHCYPWNYNNTLIVGDAAHAITPFYGQGMNAGFEDCRILDQIIKEEKLDWKKIFLRFQNERKENAEAIATLALQNFIEMRDLVADESFLLRKKMEAIIHKRIPSYLPLYTMVTFSDIPYKQAFEKGKSHDALMLEVMRIPEIQNIFQTEEGWFEIEKVINNFKEKS